MPVSPTVLARVGSGYGERTSSRTGRRTFHAGWDFVAPRGTPIYSADDGAVVIVAREQPGGPYRGYGNAVILHHPSDDTYVLYAHLERADVRQGDAVRAGQQIGTAGNTTNGKFPSMPPHLHLEVRQPSAGGGSPFPGAYGRLNLDPKDWFARRGLVIGNRSGNPPGTLVPGGTRTISGLPAIFGGAAARSSTPPCPHGWMGGPCLVCLERGLGRVPEWWETTFPPPRPPEGTPYVPAMEGNLFWDFAPAIAGAVLFNAAILLKDRRLGWGR